VNPNSSKNEEENLMLKIEVPGFGLLQLEYLVSDFTGTLSVDGAFLSGVREQLHRIAEILQIHILTGEGTMPRRKHTLKSLVPTPWLPSETGTTIEKC
jgi:soluble P-type ATPase